MAGGRGRDKSFLETRKPTGEPVGLASLYDVSKPEGGSTSQIFFFSWADNSVDR